MKTLTDIVILAVTAALVLFDVVMAALGRQTLSNAIKTWAGTDDLWVLPLFWATLFGHFFIPRALPHMEWRTLITVAILGGCLVLNLTLVRTAPVWLTGAAGLALGAGLWAQS